MTGRKQSPGFARTLIRWYDANKRDLPWRHTRDPYKIWLSEVILQQTRVAQGLAYYHTFTEKYPDVHALAAASQDDVLHTWQGLGYYSRARNLHAAAKQISQGGSFPHNYDSWLKIKGVGPYTAAAIASFCYGECRAVVDGNVVRVLARIFGIEESPDTISGKKEFLSLAGELIPASQPASFNQAIMEFGATLCTPVQPECSGCPFSSTCQANLENKQGELPAKKSRTSVRTVHLYYLIPSEKEHTMLHRRDTTGIWRGLYEFPLIESPGPLAHAAVLKRFAKDYSYIGIKKIELVSDPIVHLLTHRRLIACFIRASVVFQTKGLPGDMTVIPAKRLHEFPMPRLLTRYLEKS